MSGVSKMKVAELREALEARGLDTKGTKPFLVSRLEDAMSRDAAEHRRTVESKHRRLTKQTLSNRRLNSLQISSMDKTTSILHGSLSKCSYQTFNAQVARIVSVNHLCLPSHSWYHEDGNDKDWWRKGWIASRGKLKLICLNFYPFLIINILFQNQEITNCVHGFSGGHKLSNVANMFN